MSLFGFKMMLPNAVVYKSFPNIRLVAENKIVLR